MKTLQSFKDEFRLICCDLWGDALEAWFECCGQMNKRGILIPECWDYFPGMGGDGTDIDSYWHELFEVVSTRLLKKIGDFLFRYCQFLKFKKMDY